MNTKIRDQTVSVKLSLNTRLHRRFLLPNSMQFFVALKLHIAIDDIARFEMQPMKHGNFEQQIRNFAGIYALFTKKTSSFVSTGYVSLLVWISLVLFY